MNIELYKNSGMYFIINKINGKIYVGITKNFNERWDRHKSDLILGYKNRKLKGYKKTSRYIRHHQINLQMEFNSYYEIIGEKTWNIYDFKPIYKTNVNDFNINKYKKIEDVMILRLREYQDGYYQKTNREIYLKYVKNIELNQVNMFEENKEKIIHMYTIENKNATEISKTYKTTCGTINKYLKKWNIEMKTQSELQTGCKTDKLKDEIIDMYLNKKMSLRNIGLKLNLSKTAIGNFLRRNNIKIRKNKNSKNGKATFVKLKNIVSNEMIEFESLTKCGEFLEISRETVKKYSKKNINYKGFKIIFS